VILGLKGHKKHYEKTINEWKTKYIEITSGRQLDQNRKLKIENYCLEKVESFKYLRVDMNSRTNYFNEIKLRKTDAILRYRKPLGSRYYQKNKKCDYTRC